MARSPHRALPALMLLLLIVGTACNGQREDLGGDVLADPQQYVGEEVTVRAPITNYLSSLAYVVAGRFPSGNDLVVIDPRVLPYGEGDVVEITGTIRAFDNEELEEDANLYLNSPLYDRLAGDLVLFADEVELVEGDTGP